MAFDRITVWKFDEAPARVKQGYQGSKLPQWLALIPRSLFGADLEAVIRSRPGLEGVSKYELQSGDVVYAGSGRLDAFLTSINTAPAEHNSRGVHPGKR